MSWSFIKFSQLIHEGNVWRSVWRICMWILGLKGLNRKGADINWLLKISIRNKEKRTWELVKWSPRGKCSANFKFLKEMYEDQSWGFVWACLDQKHKVVIKGWWDKRDSWNARCNCTLNSKISSKSAPLRPRLGPVLFIWNFTTFSFLWQEVTTLHSNWENGHFYLGKYYDKLMANCTDGEEKSSKLSV